MGVYSWLNETPRATACAASPLVLKGVRTYLEPAGDPGLYGPDSMTWRVHANLVALVVGGVAAVILELAEPRVRSGVWEHSNFRTDPLARMKRTAEAAMLITFGPAAAAEARIAMINRLHSRVSGVTPEGQVYSALDPQLLEWVHLTAGYGFLNAYLRYVEPRLSRGDQDRYYREGAPVGRAFGVVDPPDSVTEVEARMEAMRPNLRAHPIIGEFLRIVCMTSPLGPPGRPLQRLLVRAAVDLLPPSLRRELNLPDAALLGAAAPLAMRAFAAAADMAPNPIVHDAHARMRRQRAV